jgi:hypothetical protein
MDLIPENTDAQQRENWAKAFAIAKMHADVFNTEAGKELLAHWERVLVWRPIVQPNDTQFAAGIREGQADIVRQIRFNLDFARKGNPWGET